MVYHCSSRLLWGFLGLGAPTSWSETLIIEREVNLRQYISRETSWEVSPDGRTEVSKGVAVITETPSRQEFIVCGFGQLWSGCCSWSLPARPTPPLRTPCWGPVPRPRWHHRLGVPPEASRLRVSFSLVVSWVSFTNPGTSRKGRTGRKDWSAVGLRVWLWHFDLNGWFVFKPQIEPVYIQHL